MANNGGIITAPVRLIADVKTVLGETSNDLSALCKSSKINMWAKYKPIRYNSTSALTESQRAYRGYGVNATRYDVDSSSVRNTMLSDSASGNTGWTYDKPRGGNEPYRLGDFLGYNHNSICPFFLEDASTTGTLKVSVGQVGSLPTGNMLVTDITGIIGLDDASKSGYGFLVKKGSTVTHIDAINSGGTGVNYPLNRDHQVTLASGSGTYQVCCYIRDYNRGDAILHPLKGFTVTIQAQSTALVSIDAYFDDLTKTKPTFYFTITGRSSNTVYSGAAKLNIYNRDGKVVDSFTFTIPDLTNGQIYTNSEKMEFGYEVYSWDFTYQGVTVRG